MRTDSVVVIIYVLYALCSAHASLRASTPLVPKTASWLFHSTPIHCRRKRLNSPLNKQPPTLSLSSSLIINDCAMKSNVLQLTSHILLFKIKNDDFFTIWWHANIMDFFLVPTNFNKIKKLWSLPLAKWSRSGIVSLRSWVWFPSGLVLCTSMWSVGKISFLSTRFGRLCWQMEKWSCICQLVGYLNSHPILQGLCPACWLLPLTVPSAYFTYAIHCALRMKYY